MATIHEGEKTYLEGALGFSPGEFASSPHGCQARMLQAIGSSLTYDDLVCYSGFAFRINVHDGLCPSGGHPFCGFVCIEGSNRALPWKMKVIRSAPWDEPKDDRAAFEAEVCAEIKSSIDRGVPVQYGGEEDGLIIGYSDEGRRWWCVHPYFEQGGTAFWHDEVGGFAGGRWPWGIVVWSEPKADVDMKSASDLMAFALSQAVEMWQSEKQGDYDVGDAAYASWLAWLRRVERGEIEDYKLGMQGNGWCYDVLVQSRRIAADWLRAKSLEFGNDTATHFRTAADHCAAIVEACMKDLACPWDLAPGPDRVDDWTSEMRIEQMARLEVSRAHDGAAVEAIEKALETLP